MGESTSSGDTSQTTDTPTTGIDPCPGYDDVCIFDSPNETKTLFQCEGFVDVVLNGDPVIAVPPDQNPFPREFQASFHGDNDVTSCCSDDYVDGCDNLPAPHLQYCHLDCAQQSCLRMVFDMEKTISAWKTAPKAPPQFVQNQFINIHNYLAAHIDDCQKSLINRTDCEVIAEERGEDPATFCTSEFILRGRYTIPDSPDWGLVENLHGDLSCEINNWSHPDTDPSTCHGIQGNNNDPFGLGGPVTLVAMQAPITAGVVVAEGPQAFNQLLGPANLSGERIEYRASVPCVGPCPFKLDTMKLTTGPLSKVGTTVHDLETDLVHVANGVQNGNIVTFPPGEIALHVTGYLTSKNKQLDGTVIDSVVLNKGNALLELGEDEIRIKAAHFFFDKFTFEVSTLMCPCSPM